MLLLALEMLLLHRAYNEGRRGALYALIPLFLLWVNLDDSFFMGLLILAAATVGRILDGTYADTLVTNPARSASDGQTEDRKASPGIRPVRGSVGLAGAGALRCGLPCQSLDLSCLFQSD